MSDNQTLKMVRRNLFFIVVGATTLAFFGLIGPFIITCFWAAVLAVIFHGMHKRITQMVGGRQNASATITTLLILLFVIVPFGLLSLALFNQAASLYASVEAGEINTTIVLDYIDESLPRLASFLEQFGVSIDDLRARLNNFVAEASQFVAGQVLSIGGSLINVFVQFTLMLYLLYFFLRDGKALTNTIIDTLPMGNIRERALFQRFAQVARATLKGTLIVAFVQGSIGGVLFASLGIPAALLWGVAMMLLSLLPVGGSAIVWVPAAIILFIQGEVVKAIIIVLVGNLIIALVDNLLRPILVGRDTHMPDYLVLISTLGGITMFGLSGFVVGPTIAALFITVWEMMGRDYGGKSV